MHIPFLISSFQHRSPFQPQHLYDRILGCAQKLLTRLYTDLNEEERKLEHSDVQCLSKPEADADAWHPTPVFAELYRVPGENLLPGRVRLVGPVGERPVHVCLLRAGALSKDSEIRGGLIEGVK